MKPSFGWDLAGYGSSGSGLCRADRQGDTITATVLRADFVCRPNLTIDSEIGNTTEIELEMLRRFAGAGNTFIDVPIDLQSLIHIADYRADERVSRYWQLVKRPVDHAFRALEPVGSNLGYAVARIAHLLGSLRKSASSLILGKSLFETYPAATLELARNANDVTEAGYKGGKTRIIGERWQPVGSNQRLKDKTREKRLALAELANRLGLHADEGLQLNDDEFDAIVCAITGCIPDNIVTGDALREEIDRRLVTMGVPEAITGGANPPNGYALLNGIPKQIQIKVQAVTCRTPDDLYTAIAENPRVIDTV